MSYSQPRRYLLYYVAGYWEQKQEIGNVYMSSMPSRDEVLEALKNSNQFDGFTSEYINNLLIDRPLGWYYKLIRVCANKDANECIWQFEPIP